MNDRVGRDGPEWPDDETARRLREALASHARAIQPSGDGLASIREKIRMKERPRGAWLRPLAVGAAALATAAIAVVAVIAVNPRSTHDNRSPLGVTSSSGSTTASSPASTSPVQSTGAPHPVTIYYVGALKDPQQLLYRETVARPAPAGNAFIRDAVTAMLTTQATDPDYVSYWPQGVTVVGASIQNDTKAVIDLSAEAATAAPNGAGMGAISAQQLFYTVHAAAPKIDAVELRIAGQPVTSLWGSAITEPITGAAPWQVFAHVWITSPLENATVASVVSFGGEATVFEGTVNWEIRMNGAVLTKGHSQASVGAPDRGTWQASVTLAPGTYTIRAYEVSAKDGSQTYVDDKVVTVK
jgi:spore germination protein GerM